ncbi:hypothetical protein HYPSUDRAFT_66794 [Hypholoma sublateritium FD-334 SS-4]|uniref:Uncharacterized protein n=1 Tax=Hypholoma sublateritium (strain FD-334 SS-4) TaxID=945553 RepID=A0A0D2PSU9_HYPSF|nr:hypothetical protein HYPSUDRAFT_66794 [Hypholoma sublateritium FD-334 SS-4]
MYIPAALLSWRATRHSWRLTELWISFATPSPAVLVFLLLSIESGFHRILIHAALWPPSSRV